MRVLQVLAGSAQALYELGVCYYNGSVVAEDERKSFLLFERAAELGHVGAMFMYHSALSLPSTISHPTPVFCLFVSQNCSQAPRFTIRLYGGLQGRDVALHACMK